MSFKIIQGDITKMNTEAIVNATNIYLTKGIGVSAAIHEQAGEELRRELRDIGGCKVGEAVITKGYNLKAKYIIHAVGPVWQGGTCNEKFYLKNAYINSLLLAKEKNLKSISIPLIASGNYGYPKEEALEIAVSTIKEFLKDNEMDINLVVYDRRAVAISREKYNDITKYIQNNYNRGFSLSTTWTPFGAMGGIVGLLKSKKEHYSNERNIQEYTLQELLENITETFQEMLFRLIDKSGMTDVEVYKKANIDRRLFSKIKTNNAYTPKIKTALSLAIALELNLEQTNKLLETLGYTLSTSKKFDVIIMYFIEKKEYDIFKIEEVLFELLGETLTS